MPSKKASEIFETAVKGWQAIAGSGDGRADGCAHAALPATPLGVRVRLGELHPVRAFVISIQYFSTHFITFVFNSIFQKTLGLQSQAITAAKRLVQGRLIDVNFSCN